MTVKTTKQDLFSWLETIFQEPPGAIRETRARNSIANWDSMGTLLLIAELDDRLHVTLSEEELKSIASVSDLMAALRGKQVVFEDE